MVPRRARSEDPDLGQHVLIDPGAIEKLVAAASLADGDTVLEPGAGRGAITERLSRAVQPAGRVVAIEYDERLASDLAARRLPCVEVVEGDALSVAWPSRVDAVVANPPFRILSPLGFRILERRVPRSALVVPFEFANRLLARPRALAYGQLTIAVAIRANVRGLFSVPRRAFHPPPEVSAAAVLLTPRPVDPDLDLALLDELLNVAWESKEQTLRHGLAPIAARLHVSSARITQVLAAHGWGTKRPSELAPEDWTTLTREIQGQAKRRGQSNPPSH